MDMFDWSPVNNGGVPPDDALHDDFLQADHLKLNQLEIPLF